MNQKAIGILFQISVVLISILSPLAAADSSPNLPMILSGTVNDITGEAAPEGTSVIAKDSETGNILGETTVDSNGEYGSNVNDHLLVNECSSFDVYIILDGKEVKVDTLTWEEGIMTDPCDIEYSIVTDTRDNSGGSSGGGSYNASFSSSVSDTETGIAGGAGLEAAPDSNQEVAATSSVIPTNEDESSSLPAGLIVIALVGIIGIIVFLAYKRSQ